MSSLSAEGVRWLEACRRAVTRQRGFLASITSTASVGAEMGIGAGGDVSLAIDREFEAIVLDELAPLTSRPGATAFVVSEEAGEPEDDATPNQVWVLIDPVDGSTNAGNRLPQFSLCVALASGPFMADVWFAFVFDFGANEEFVCEKSRSTLVNGEAATQEVGRTRLIGVESAEPSLLAAGLGRVAEAGIKEIRVVGSIAIELCYVGLGRLDGLMTCGQCRSVDAAAGHLFATSLGSTVLFDGRGPASAGLRLAERYRLVAGRPELVQGLLEAQQMIPLVRR